MSEREQIISLLDRVPEYDLRSVLILVRGLASSHEDYVEHALDEADAFAETNSVFYSHDEFHELMRRKYNV